MSRLDIFFIISVIWIVGLVGALIFVLVAS
jgi:hypothetical protein